MKLYNVRNIICAAIFLAVDRLLFVVFFAEWEFQTILGIKRREIEARFYSKEFEQTWT